jgi:hypothetical protein
VLVSDGIGYAIGYVSSYPSLPPQPQAFARAFNGANWEAETRLSTPLDGVRTTGLTGAGRTGAYLFAWIEETATSVSAKSWRATTTPIPQSSYETVAWDARTDLASQVASRPIALAAGPGGFAAVYGLGSSEVAAKVMTNGAWGTKTTLRVSGDAYAIASNGTGYLAVIGSSAGAGATTIHPWSSGMWNAGRNLPFSTGPVLRVASRGSAYGLFAERRTPPGELVFLGLPDSTSGAIGAPVRIGTSNPGLDFGPAPVATPQGFLAAWLQKDAQDPTLDRVYARGGL